METQLACAIVISGLVAITLIGSVASIIVGGLLVAIENSPRRHRTWRNRKGI
jgi:hypothetical protein